VEKENKGLLITLVVLVVLSLIASFALNVGVNSKVSDSNDKLAELEKSMAIENNAVSAEEVQGIVNTAIASIKPTEVSSEGEVIVDVPDSSKVDKLCELTDGCEYYTIKGTDKELAINLVKSNVPSGKDFIRAFSNLVSIDKKYLVVDSVNLKDSKVIALTKSDKKDENFKVQLFYKIKYSDVDEEDTETIYVVVTSLLDEGDYDSLSVEKVERTFEFE